MCLKKQKPFILIDVNGIKVWDVIIQLILEIQNFLQLNASMEVIMLGMFILNHQYCDYQIIFLSPSDVVK